MIVSMVMYQSVRGGHVERNDAVPPRILAPLDHIYSNFAT